MKIKNLFKGEGFVNFSSSILAIVCGLLFGLIILLISNPSQAFGGFMMIIQGGFTDGMQGFGQVLYMATPLIMTGLSVGFAFKTGLFNIGASGQFTAGAFAAVYVGVKFTFLPPGVHCLAALLAAILAGALWGMVPGLLKAFFNVNEVISSIMMNYIGMYLTNMLIQKTVYDQVKNQSMAVAEGANLPKGGLDKLFPGASINVGILIAIGCVILIYILLNKTIFGYELKACGMNPDASRYAGINEKQQYRTFHGDRRCALRTRRSTVISGKLRKIYAGTGRDRTGRILRNFRCTARTFQSDRNFICRTFHRIYHSRRKQYAAV